MLLSALAVPLWAVPTAHAELAKEPASMGAYFYRGGVTQPAGTPDSPQPIPNAPADADGVSPDNLAVAAQGGQEDKVSFLSFSLVAAPLEGTIDSAVLSVPLVASSPPNDLVYNAAPERVRVCKAGEQGFFGEDAASITLAPDRLCEEFASEPGKLSADKLAYEFNIVGLAATWLEVNDGLALTIAEGAESSPFQIVFAPADQATLSYSFTSTDESFDAPPFTDTTIDSGSAPIDSGFSGGGLPADDGGFGSVDSPMVDELLPEPTGAEPAGPEPAVAAPTSPAAAMTEAQLTPSPAFWLGLLALAAVGALMSLIMGDSRVPSASAASQSRLSKALQSRQAAAAAGGARLSRPATL